jgi:hypothetical protein
MYLSEGSREEDEEFEGAGSRIKKESAMAAAA